jgi:hypothetical protein
MIDPIVMNLMTPYAQQELARSRGQRNWRTLFRK